MITQREIAVGGMPAVGNRLAVRHLLASFRLAVIGILSLSALLCSASVTSAAAVLLEEIQYIQPPLLEDIGIVVIRETLDHLDGTPGSENEVAFGSVPLDFSGAGHTNKWWVQKSVTNTSEDPWRDFHIVIHVNGTPSPRSPSPQSDGISFGERFGVPPNLDDPLPVAIVDPNTPPGNPFAGGWTGEIMNLPFDEIQYLGAPTVLPGETIHFLFPLSGTTIINEFTFSQSATIPEPGSMTLALFGGLGAFCLWRRRSR